MPIYRAVISTWLDSDLPGDAMQITPHFDDTGLGTDPEGLADDLLAAWRAYCAVGVQNTKMSVKLYDAMKAPPSYPVAIAEQAGTLANSASNRDIALCLSYFASVNRPRHRGRLYIPLTLIGQAVTGANAGVTVRQKVGDLVPVLAGLGGVDVDWVVFSRVDRVARKVSDWWVDDAWDTQRRRGKRPTTRLTGSTSG